MTCMPASRRARATTLMPRSWPSSPTLARTTRMGGAEVMARDGRGAKAYAVHDTQATGRLTCESTHHRAVCPGTRRRAAEGPRLRPDRPHARQGARLPVEGAAVRPAAVRAGGAAARLGRP